MPAILYIYFSSTPLISLQNPALSQAHSLPYPSHDIDLFADEQTWHYSKKWLESYQHIILVLDAQPSQEIGEGAAVLSKKLLSKLLRLDETSKKIGFQIKGKSHITKHSPKPEEHQIKYKGKFSVAYLNSFLNSPFSDYCGALKSLPSTSIASVNELDLESFGQ